MDQGSQIRDVFSRSSVSALAERIHSVFQDFAKDDFIESTIKDFAELSLSERNLEICKGLEKYLPASFPKAVNILLEALGDELKEDELEASRGFIIMPQTIFVARNGMENFELSMHALEEMTKRFSSEFAIRYFIIEEPKKTLEQMKKWAVHENCHVRRLASEGSRPLLPWAMRLNEFVKNPAPVIEILELMKNSPERYVERSVANNLNDISKHHPQLVTDLLSKWQKEKISPWLISHALRTLFKKGNPEALKLNGFDPEAKIEVSDLEFVKSQIKLGESIEFSFKIVSEGPQKLMIDYIVHHMKANGKTSPKVFKLAKKTISGEETVIKKHSIREITTRKYYPGSHLLQIQINGKVYAESSFELHM